VLTVFAPAKVNLHLHVTGRQSDGYHLLDSLAVFADIGDTLVFEPSKVFSFTAEGPFAGLFSSAEIDTSPQSKNLVVKAALRLSALLARELNVSIRLIKNLPLGSGLGGGSTDAAACLRGLCQLWNVPLSQPHIDSLALQLGRDVPVCLKSRTCIMRGTGEHILSGPNLPELPVVLAWPARPVSTAEIFQSLKMPRYSSPVEFPDHFDEPDALCDFLNHSSRNDLQQVSLTLPPVISDTLSAISQQSGCLLARMSGSGSACFGIFKNEGQAHRAADAMRLSHPDWWIQAGWLNRIELGNSQRA
jgi:4-diphosphocytidyl-2-C-methyl-D-erythritol kinase